MTTTRFISSSRREARSRSPTRARPRCPGSPASARSEASASLSAVHHNCLNGFTGFGELAGLAWLQGQEKKGRTEGEKSCKMVGLLKASRLPRPRLPLDDFLSASRLLVPSFCATVARENCNFHQAPPPVANHPSRCSAISPSFGPPPPPSPAHLISLAISIPRLGGVSTQRNASWRSCCFLWLCASRCSNYRRRCVVLRCQKHPN